MRPASHKWPISLIYNNNKKKKNNNIMVWVPALESECGTVASPPPPTLSSSQNMHIYTRTHTDKMANFFPNPRPQR